MGTALSACKPALQQGETNMRFSLMIFIILTLTGCLTQADQQKGADKVVNSLHHAILAHQWDDAAALYKKGFFQQQPRAQWQHTFKTLETSLGKIEAFKVISKQKDPRYGGDFYIYSISVKHQHGYSHETITVYKGLEDTSLSITGYKITAMDTQ
jgi:hypothetical protein